MADSPLRYLSANLCRSLLDVSKVVQRIEEVYSWQANGEIVHLSPDSLRIFHQPTSYKSHTKVVLLPRLSVAGVRVVGYCVQEDGSGPSSPSSTRLVVLIDLETGSPLAIVDEHYNYTLRTAASVGVAARHLFPGNPTLGLIGVGGVGRAVARVFSEILPLEKIYITSRTSESRESFLRELEPELQVPIQPLDSIEALLSCCNVVVTATTTRSVLVQWSQVGAGTLLCALGSGELAPEVYNRATKVLVDDWSHTRAAPDMNPIIKNGLFSQERLYGELAELVSGEKAGRESESEVIVVRTEGMVSQDVALAHWVYQEAQRRGFETEIAGRDPK